MERQPWVSFCISTYKRPNILHKQLQLLAQQTFPDFEVIISDNDPSASAKIVVESLNDSRFKYFPNNENIGMIRSFNKSIERANTEFIVMVTDDDPIAPDFLQTFYYLYKQFPKYSIYCGFKRSGKEEGFIEHISNDEFLIEVLDPRKTTNLLWSSSVMRRLDVIKTAMIPDYGSPHLADHAIITQVGSINGGLIINKMYSSLTSHDENFSKLNFESYIKGCTGFYNYLQHSFKKHPKFRQYERIIIKHLGTWFIANIFNLKKYYTIKKKNKAIIKNLNELAQRIISLPFMERYKFRYFFKTGIFYFKRILGLLS